MTPRAVLLRLVNAFCRRHMLKIERVDDMLARATRRDGDVPYYLRGSDE